MHDTTVLVAVLPRPRDLVILRRARWYRVPLAFLPKRRFRYLAFYQPAAFGRHGKRIAYYAEVLGRRVVRRLALLPREPRHPHARDRYVKITVGKLHALPHPVRNITPRRVSFGFTTLKKLLSARNLLALYDVPPTEELVRRGLRRAGIRALPEFPVSIGNRRFRLDFAVMRRGRRIAIECDNEKAHAGKAQRGRDRIKERYLRRAGWRVIRLKERDIILDLDACMKKVLRLVG